MNKNSLRAVMIEHGDTAASLASYLSISKGSFSRKLNEKNSAGFTQPEITAIKKRYDLTANQVDKIFFETVVS
ncbi:MAG: hypothetical protein ACTTKS_02310 [Bulleidia sp.]